MNLDIILALISAASAIIVAAIGKHAVTVNKKTEKLEKEREEREKRREKEMRLSMDMMYATLQLSIVRANALTNGHNNGNVAVAYSAAQAAKDKYDEFLKDVASHSL